MYGIIGLSLSLQITSSHSFSESFARVKKIQWRKQVMWERRAELCSCASFPKFQFYFFTNFFSGLTRQTLPKSRDWSTSSLLLTRFTLQLFFRFSQGGQWEKEIALIVTLN